MKKNKESQVYVCCICGKIIYPKDVQEYVRTRRGTEIRFHRSCVRRRGDADY